MLGGGLLVLVGIGLFTFASMYLLSSVAFAGNEQNEPMTFMTFFFMIAFCFPVYQWFTRTYFGESDAQDEEEEDAVLRRQG